MELPDDQPHDYDHYDEENVNPPQPFDHPFDNHIVDDDEEE